MNIEELEQYHEQGYTHVPLIKVVPADLDTPLSIYLKLANQPYSYLLESVQGGETWGRYSIIGLSCRRRITIENRILKLWEQDNLVEEHHDIDPWQWLKDYLNRFHTPERTDLPRFTGGLVGYFGHESIRYIEPRLADNDLPDMLGCPEVLLLHSDEVAIFDNFAGRLWLVTHVDTKNKETLRFAQARLNSWAERLKQPFTMPNELNQIIPREDIEPHSFFPQQDFKKAVETIKDYIKAGDVMQVVLSQRQSIACDIPPLNIYRSLRRLNPSPYMFYFNMNDFYIVGASPEILVHLEQNQVSVRPIAGTRPRGVNQEADLVLEKELKQDPKELAEHLMLIDLGRNDIGRVCEIGSVKVTEKMVIERYSHVMHLVSHVTGQLKENLDAIEVLKATFPAGTLSGAPKIRAMEIIQELEPIKRGIYGGAVGYLAWGGAMDTAIAIRTAVIKDQQIYIQAGAGIVYDSIPESEWQETLNKARALWKAINLAQKEWG